MADEYTPGPDRRSICPPPVTEAGEGGPPHPVGRRRYTPRRKVCMFCTDKVRTPDYKDIKRLQRHISDRGKILPRRRTGACARHQRGVANAVKRARHMALLPFVATPSRA